MIEQILSNIEKSAYLAIISVVLGLTVLAQTDSVQKKSERLTANEVVSKHIASIGLPEALAATKSRVLVGNGALSGRAGIAGRIVGPVQFASQGEMIVFAMMLNSNEHPYEKVGFNGKDVTTGRPSGSRTPLGDFLEGHKGIVKQGLFGGALSTAWPLLANRKGVKYEFAGTTEVQDQRLHKLKFSSSGTNELGITLYFDAETFRHVMTEYKFSVDQGGGPTLIVGAAQTPTYFNMTEHFSNFSKVGDLVLPLKYVIDVSMHSPTDTLSLQWTSIFTNGYFSETLDAAAFKVS